MDLTDSISSAHSNLSGMLSVWLVHMKYIYNSFDVHYIWFIMELKNL